MASHRPLMWFRFRFQLFACGVWGVGCGELPKLVFGALFAMFFFGPKTPALNIQHASMTSPVQCDYQF
jgi:hypothetical protein